ncbi:MAG: hypothetical protein EOR67_16110 [Mesorhizobium sp.]|uniref:hypothetical protein n=1 Tax=Mesorhizobium sp. TaxID=1871066 RepID=UPI000FE74E26|nr:hypothetical protein [Mesorhizobium sp.]RWL87721.1 MAG: hypothetical protein EOR67_16110 [Mesorhizobium sp.]
MSAPDAQFTEEQIRKAEWFLTYALGAAQGTSVELLEQRFRLTREKAAELLRLVKGQGGRPTAGGAGGQP